MRIQKTSVFEELSPPYATIMADPPWEYPRGFATQSRSVKWTAKSHEVSLPYSSMAVSEIKSLPVGDIAATDCRIFLWTTNRYLPQAFDVLEAWGFRYRQTLVWHKLDGNTGGGLVPNSAEFLLVAVRGKPAVIGKGRSAVIAHSQAKTHSVKPAAFADLVEATSPAPYVELFARSPRLGWDAWGYGYE